MTMENEYQLHITVSTRGGGAVHSQIVKELTLAAASAAKKAFEIKQTSNLLYSVVMFDTGRPLIEAPMQGRSLDGRFPPAS